ncbi:MAG: amino acid ABC transporter substrate-binding protein [Anaerolineae bacterium]|nr:amino acid ABC transporter substrate-binding protein [Anaerolineae bacterium]
MLWKRLLPVLMLALLLTVVACADSGGETVEVTRLVEVTRIVETGAGEGEAAPAPVQVGAGEILQRVLDRGRVVCGARTDLAGFGYLDEAGNTIGFDVDLCRAVATALFNDPEAVEIVNLTAADRGPSLQTGEVDMLSRNVTWTSSRDAQWGNFTLITFYDGQGFLVPADTDIFEIEDLDGATVCVTTGTTTQLNLSDAFRQRGLEYTDVSFEDTATVYSTYEGGGCDAATSDKSQLAAIQSGLENPDAHRILDITISKEPLTSAVPHGDDQWFDVVKTVIYVLINAEELGVTSGNVDEMMTSENVEVRRLLGQEGEFGQADLGLDADFAANVIRAVGNYGEIYDRYMGPDGHAFTLNRGLNNLWTEGGLIYAPPLR